MYLLVLTSSIAGKYDPVIGRGFNKYYYILPCLCSKLQTIAVSSRLL